MAAVRIGMLVGWVVGWFRFKPKQQGPGLEGGLRQALTDTARRSKQEIAAELRADLRQIEERYGVFPDSARLIREDRDVRG
jgi:hypothetical protein